MALNVAGATLTTPVTVTGWKDWHVLIDAPSPQSDPQGRVLAFVSWSDGGAQTHTATLPGNDVIYTAAFTPNYVHPKGATPLHASLVPAHMLCTSPNRTHAAPLTFDSCSPPEQASGYLTVGTPDANGEADQSTGSVTLEAMPGDASTPADEADARIETTLTDVRVKADLSDYTGELATVLHVRLTDRLSNVAMTVEDFPFSVTVPCSVTADPTIGSTCSLTTTADTVLPGAVPEAARSIWALDGVDVYDGGPDGLASTTGGNTLFETQGVFAP